MTRISRRSFLAGTLAAAAPLQARAARMINDSAGRSVTLPDKVARVMAAGPPASVVLYCLAPDRLVGWQRMPRPEEKPYLLPFVRDLPEIGRLTGRGDTANLEVVIKARPDLIVDFGSVTPTYVSLANATQERSGIPYALIDGRFNATPAALRLLADMLDVPARGEALARYTEDLFQRVDTTIARTPDARRPGVYLARGALGLETALRGSINAEIVERAGGRNVADAQDSRRGIANVSPEQLLLWKPDVIVTWDRNFFRMVTREPDEVWRSLPAVINKRVYLAPTVPFGWIDGPPSVNRLLGLAWLASVLPESRFAFDIRNGARAFYKLFYQVDLSDQELETLVAWADGQPPHALVRP